MTKPHKARFSALFGLPNLHRQSAILGLEGHQPLHSLTKPQHSPAGAFFTLAGAIKQQARK
jgi:hypothetical protein